MTVAVDCVHGPDADVAVYIRNVDVLPVGVVGVVVVVVVVVLVSVDAVGAAGDEPPQRADSATTRTRPEISRFMTPLDRKRAKRVTRVMRVAESRFGPRASNDEIMTSASRRTSDDWRKMTPHNDTRGGSTARAVRNRGTYRRRRHG